MRRKTRKQKRRAQRRKQRGGDSYSRLAVIVAPPSNDPAEEIDAVAAPMSADDYDDLTDPERPA